MDSTEFEEFFAKYHSRFVTFARGYVHDRLVAEDLVADSFVYFWENRGRIDSADNPPSYVLKTVKNKCLNYLRTQQVRQRVFGEMSALENRVLHENIRSLELCDPGELFAGEVERLVCESLGAMPPLMRAVFEARRMRGESYREIAAALGISERRVETELTKALDMLRKVLEDYLPAVLTAMVFERFIR